MAKVKKVNENISFNYGSREADSGDTVMDVNISFENPADDSIIVHRLNTWLTAIGRSDLVVSYVEKRKGFDVSK
jgi:hypothetical protein